jgi:hypothetical protein
VRLLWNDRINTSVRLIIPRVRDGEFADSNLATATNPVSSGDTFHPLSPPFGCCKRFAKVLRFAPYFAGPKLHDADCVVGLALIFDDVLRDPEFATARHPPNPEAGGFTGMMGAEGLQIVTTVNALAGLWIVANDVLVVDGVFGVLVAGAGCPVRFQRLAVCRLLMTRCTSH